MLRVLRRKGLVAEFVSVYLHHVQRAVYIATDGGRVRLTYTKTCFTALVVLMVLCVV
jgi:hypothetical protein